MFNRENVPPREISASSRTAKSSAIPREPLPPSNAPAPEVINFGNPCPVLDVPLAAVFQGSYRGPYHPAPHCPGIVNLTRQAKKGAIKLLYLSLEKFESRVDLSTHGQRPPGK
jgi:hypothetical protein